MNNKFFTAMFLPLLLAGCDQPQSHSTVKPSMSSAKEMNSPVVPAKPLVDFPALPVIENTVSQLAPRLDAQFDISVIQRICVLARGDVSKERILESIRQDGLDPATIPAQGNPLSLLVNDEHKKRAELCAAWLASGADRAPGEEELTVQQSRQIGKKGKERTVTENVLSNGKVAQALAVKLSILRANAEIYTLIASELEKEPGLSLEEYALAVSKKFSALSPFYLKRVQELYSPEPDSYHLTKLSAEGYAFDTDGGYNFIRDGGNTLLTYRGINWLGRGQIMGKDYRLAVSYFPDALIKASLEAN